MRPTARLINVGRGELVDEQPMIQALHERRLAGAALDVVHHEPLPPRHPLWTCPGTIISPHMEGDVVGWRNDLLDLFLENLQRFQYGVPLLNVVDTALGYVATRAGSVEPADATTSSQGVR